MPYNKLMTLQNIDFNRKNLTIMGVKFPDAVSLDLAASAIASNMYEGFKPTPYTIALIRDYNSGAISLSELVKIIKK